MSNFKNKTLAREYAFKFTYPLVLDGFDQLIESYRSAKSQEVFLEDALADFDESYVEPDKEHPDNTIEWAVKKHSVELIKNLFNNFEEIDEKLNKALKDVNQGKLSKIDRAILTLGILELKYSKDVPEKVVINEYINIAKKFSVKESAGFVNAILDKVAKGN